MNLWPVQHFFPHFLTGLLFLHSKPVKKRGKKSSTGQRFICTEVTSYKIHTLIRFLFNTLFPTVLDCSKTTGAKAPIAPLLNTPLLHFLWITCYNFVSTGGRWWTQLNMLTPFNCCKCLQNSFNLVRILLLCYENPAQTTYSWNIMCQKWEGDCGLWVPNEIISKKYTESLKKIVGAVLELPAK